MIKDIMESKLANCSPTERLHKLTVSKNEIDDMIKDFHKNWNWCQGCQTYINVDESYIEFMHDFDPARNALKCKHCRTILKLLD